MKTPNKEIQLSETSREHLRRISMNLATVAEWCRNQENPSHFGGDNILQNIDFDTILMQIVAGLPDDERKQLALPGADTYWVAMGSDCKPIIRAETATHQSFRAACNTSAGEAAVSLLRHLLLADHLSHLTLNFCINGRVATNVSFWQPPFVDALVMYISIRLCWLCEKVIQHKVTVNK